MIGCLIKLAIEIFDTFFKLILEYYYIVKNKTFLTSSDLAIKQLTLLTSTDQCVVIQLILKNFISPEKEGCSLKTLCFEIMKILKNEIITNSI